jgi:hypothetical protein
MIVGTAIGAGTAIGLGTLVSMGLAAVRGEGKPPSETEKTIIEYSPLVGAGAVFAIGMLAPKFKSLGIPAAIGAALVFALAKMRETKPKAANAYNRLGGAGNVTRVLNSGAGNVARVLNTTAAVR